MGEVVDDSAVFTIKLKEEGAKAVVTKIIAPAEAAKGEEITVEVTMKNIGNITGEFRGYLIDEASGNTIDKEPDAYYKNVVAGGSYTFTLKTSFDPFWAMPDHDWLLRIEVRRQV